MSRPPSTSFQSPRLVVLAAALILAPGVAASRVGAEERPAAKERLAPDGIDGALVLCADRPSDPALDAFCGLAGKDRARVVVVGQAGAVKDEADNLTAAIKDRKPASVQGDIWDLKSRTLPDALRKATGVWLLPAGGDRPTDLTGVPDAAKEMRELLRRGGVIAASGSAAAALARPAVAAAASEGGTPAGLGLLPGVLLDPHFRKGDGEGRLFEALGHDSEFLGVGLGEGAALIVHGRRLSLAGPRTVTVCLAASSARPRRVVEIDAEHPSDLTMLRRAAISRAGAPWPPKQLAAPEVPNGALVIVGGGGMPADVTLKFIELAGGPDARIVVLPTANIDAPAGDEGGFFKRAGAKNVVALPARKIEDVEDPRNLDIVRKANAVWFGGGRQWRFVDAYEGTKAYDLFHDVLRHGGVIGGSSAGATIQGDYLSRGSPLNNTDMMCEGYERAFGFLPGVVVDQHFRQRDRFADMTALMKTYPQLLGVGLDEATAIVVRGHEAEVMGRGEAHFYDRNKPVEDDKPDYEDLKAGGRYDLKARKILRAADDKP